jgi:acyl-CoA thioesterase I
MQQRQGLGMRTIVAILALAMGWLGPIARAAAEGRPLRIVVLGDSLTAGYGIAESAAFPAVLERALRRRGHDVAVVNAGVSGDTATGGLERLDWSVPEGVDGVILELGGNDMLRGIDPEVIRTALEGIIRRLAARHIPVMLAGMRAAPNLGEAYAARFDAIYPDLARTYGLVLYPFFLDGVADVRTLNLSDGMHPSPSGVERIVEGILPYVETFVGRIQAER